MVVGGDDGHISTSTRIAGMGREREREEVRGRSPRDNDASRARMRMRRCLRIRSRDEGRVWARHEMVVAETRRTDDHGMREA